MFYENLNMVLGRLFYYTAAVNGKVHNVEKEVLHDLVQKNWKQLENAKDEFGTDLAYQIDFAFDFEESKDSTENGYLTFKDFYLQNKNRFTPAVKENILNTVKEIAASFHGKSKAELELINKVNLVLTS